MDRDICARLGLIPDPPSPESQLGVSASALDSDWPLHGLRHPPHGMMNGWYLWAGELSEDDDFFKPVHVEHLPELLPRAIPYLSLPPGWRFLIAPDYEDIWHDPSLLDIDRGLAE